MMHFITGGARSGKSSYALSCAENITEEGRLFIATCPRIDGEMDARIARHQAEREGRGWRTHECEVELVETLAYYNSAENAVSVILIDCLTLWVNNLLYHNSEGMGEDLMQTYADKLAQSLSQHCADTIIVSNEVGMGIVPDDEITRRYRDIAGRCNRIIADAADRVTFMVSGQPLVVK